MTDPAPVSIKGNFLAKFPVLRYNGHKGWKQEQPIEHGEQHRVNNGMSREKTEGGEEAGRKGTKQGTVRSFDPGRGSGEIEADSGETIQVFRSALRDEALSGLFPGDIVSFQIGRDRFGRRVAQEVRRIGWDEGEDPDAPPREWTF